MSKRRLHTSSRANRPCSRADIPSDRHVPAQRECSDSIFAVEDDNEVGDVRANLETPPKTASGNT
jgi:hypothetical protein